MSPKRKYLALAITLIALIDLGVSGYLSWVALEAGKVVGCGAASGFDCDEVLASRWSKWLGLPVSLFGTLTYLGILALCWPAAARPRSWATTALFTLGLMAAGAAVWFIGLQAFVIGSYCLYCMAAHCCGIVVAVLTMLMFVDGEQADNVDQMRSLLGVADATSAPAAESFSEPLNLKHLFVSLGVAAVGLTLLMGGQVFVEPPEAMAMEEVELPSMAVTPDSPDSQEEVSPEQPATGPTTPEPEQLTDTRETTDPTPTEQPAQLEAEPSEIPEAPDMPKEPAGEMAIATDQDTLAEADDLDWLEDDLDFIEDPLAPASSQSDTTPTATLPTPEMPTIGSLLDSGPRMLVYNNLPDPVDPRELPILGDTDAPHVLVEMMDYTCSHCRHLHPRIHASLERYGDQVAYLIYHCPLSKDCNPYVKRNHTGKKYACDYAQLAIGVWKLAPKKFPEFHNWLMEGEKPPLITKAKARAIELVGPDILTDSKNKAEIGRRLGQQCTTLNRLNSGLPLLLFTQGALRGVPKTNEQWFEYLEEKLGLNPELAKLEQ